MPPRKPRQSEPGPAPPAAAKKSRTSLPATSHSSPKPTSKTEIVEHEEEVGQPSMPTSKRAKVGAKSPAKKKARTDPVDAEEDGGGDEQTGEQPVKGIFKSIAKSTTGPKSKKGAAGLKPSSIRPTRQGSSKGKDKISEIYAAGNEVLADTSVQTRLDTVTATLDKLEAQISIPTDQIKKLGHARSTMQTDFSATCNPLEALLKDRAELVSRLNSAMERYQELPARLREVLLSLDKVQTGAAEAGSRYIEDAQDFSSFTRGTKRFLSWT
ncbi:uncharacterized protein MKK02DRAFT_41104 [Dioszegia hungarica]|uniref:Uncharacterized protein n=1 Tax=Dioszegia hungarica TaxID=4972 RepID=A0AA38H1E0_9TREE|nr:uncharacterized protein MKK02DRAFT_41104 [Dioszegia hungarica]KAI9632792.1 hypothetical protein MKK02DRAFT_41104 [Dioszegia hungarica]